MHCSRPDTTTEAIGILRSIFREIRVYPRAGRGNLAVKVEAYPHLAWLSSASQGLVMPQVVAEERIGLSPPLTFTARFRL
jgi:hypothetical protein